MNRINFLDSKITLNKKIEFNFFWSIGVFIVLFAILYGYASLLEKDYATLKVSTSRLNTEVQSLISLQEALRRPDITNAQVINELQTPIYWYKFIAELAQEIPDFTFLKNITGSLSPPRKLVINASTSDLQAILKLQANLQKSSTCKKTTLNTIRKDGKSTKKGMLNFVFECEIP